MVADGRLWNAVRRSTLPVCLRGVTARSAQDSLSVLDSGPNCPKFVETSGGNDEHIDEPEDSRPTLERPVQICHTLRPALATGHAPPSDTAVR